MKISYPVQHWLLTILISPILLIVYDHLFDLGLVYDDEVSLYLMMVYYGFVFSLPSVVFYYLLFLQLSKMAFPDKTVKSILLVVAVLLSAISLWLIGGSLMDSLMVVYGSGIVIAYFILPWVARAFPT